MKKKTRLLLWMLFCIVGLIGNVILLTDYVNRQNNFRIFVTGIWIIVFTVAAYSTFIKYRKEIRQNSPDSIN